MAHEKYFTITEGVTDETLTLLEDSDKASIFAHMIKTGQAHARPSGDGASFLCRIISENNFTWPEVLIPTEFKGAKGQHNWDLHESTGDIVKHQEELTRLSNNLVKEQLATANVETQISASNVFLQLAKDKRDAAQSALDAQG